MRDGDFLVRESHGAPGQFVLTGLQNGVKKHLLLVDPEGVVSAAAAPVCACVCGGGGRAAAGSSVSEV